MEKSHLSQQSEDFIHVGTSLKTCANQGRFPMTDQSMACIQQVGQWTRAKRSVRCKYDPKGVEL